MKMNQNDFAGRKLPVVNFEALTVYITNSIQI